MSDHEPRDAAETSLARAQRIAHLGSWELNLVDGRVFWSDEIYRIFGLEQERDKPVAFAQFDHPDDVAGVKKATEDSKRLREPFNIDHRIVRRDGSIRWVQERGEFF